LTTAKERKAAEAAARMDVPAETFELGYVRLSAVGVLIADTLGIKNPAKIKQAGGEDAKKQIAADGFEAAYNNYLSLKGLKGPHETAQSKFDDAVKRAVADILSSVKDDFWAVMDGEVFTFTYQRNSSSLMLLWRVRELVQDWWGAVAINVAIDEVLMCMPASVRRRPPVKKVAKKKAPVTPKPKGLPKPAAKKAAPK